MPVKIYDADQVTLSCFGFNVDSGLADGEFCALEREMSHRSAKSGTDGEVVVSKNNSKLATLHIKVMQTSDANTKLSAILELDRRKSNGAGVGKFILRDRSGTALHSGTCWIQDVPGSTFAREATEREWTLGVTLDVDFPGGS